MVGRGMMQRITELERVGDKFTGYAVLDVEAGQTLEGAKADWIAEHGPLANRHWVVFDFGGLNNATA